MTTFAASLVFAFVLQDSRPASGTEPDWSPDGTRIAFGVAEGSKRSLWTIDADGSRPRRLVAAAN
ncbi:MAG TPA: hypothetical protein VKE69_06760, partial [Planctomycetota bacterium]|nr:hypothetical protein [Planctomycetota bacterium]